MKILLVLVRTLGDCIYINNIIDEIRKKYKDPKITVVIDSQYIDLIRSNPYIEQIMVNPPGTKSWIQRWDLILNYIKEGTHDEYMIPQQLTGEDNIWHHQERYNKSHLLNFYLSRCRLPKVDMRKQQCKIYVDALVEDVV